MRPTSSTWGGGDYIGLGRSRHVVPTCPRYILLSELIIPWRLTLPGVLPATAVGVMELDPVFVLGPLRKRVILLRILLQLKPRNATLLSPPCIYSGYPNYYDSDVFILVIIMTALDRNMSSCLQ